MKKYLLIFLLCFVATPALAANTTGYAWSESVGWFDFSPAAVSDTTLSGNAYNDNTGWLVLDGIINTNGTLSGYAWSESVGYFDFSDVTVSNGTFKGYAYNDNTGWLSFEIGTNVTTTWTPAVAVVPQPTRSLGGHRRVLPTPTPPTLPSTNTPSDLTFGVKELKLGDKGSGVKIIQTILNTLGYTVSKTGPGSQGNETDKFGALTKQALIKLQKENNITPTDGNFNSPTKAVILKKLLNLLEQLKTQLANV
jgi:hypothetical protein